MRVLLAVLLIGIAGCGCEDNSPNDVAVPPAPAAKKSAVNRGSLTLTGHPGGGNSVTFSPDRKRFVSGSWDKVVKNVRRKSKS